MKATGLRYQQALTWIRKNQERSAHLARERGWPLWRSDLELACGEAAPIDVVEIVEETLESILERLAAQTVAREVRLFEDGTESKETLLELGGLSFFTTPVEDTKATLLVVFDEDSSYGLVLLRSRQAVEDLARLLRRRRRDAPLPPPASSGPSGLPAEAWLSLTALRKKS
jgi:hypothetical protein